MNVIKTREHTLSEQQCNELFVFTIRNFTNTKKKNARHEMQFYKLTFFIYNYAKRVSLATAVLHGGPGENS